MESIDSTDDQSAPLLGEEKPQRGNSRTMQERRDRFTDISATSASDGERGRERTFSASDMEVELEGWEGSCCCHPQAFMHRVMALILMCLLGFGSYFCFDNPGALQSEMRGALNITNAEFATLYSWYSWPNVILPIVGGFLMDRVLGIRLGTVVCAFIIVIGQGIVAVGGFLDSLWIMQIGRFVFGIGGESLAVAQNTYAVAWFKGKELNMVFGFQLSVARVGSTVNFLVMEPIFRYMLNFTEGYEALAWALLLAGSSCVMSFLCSLALAWMDKRRSKILGLSDMEGESGEVARISDVKSFPLAFWFLCLAITSYYGVIFPFVSLAQEFFKTKFDFTSEQANRIIGLVYLVSAPASPLLGLVLDKTGRNISWVLLAIIISLGCHFMLNYTQWNPYVAIIVMGFAYSLLASALWPIAALLIPEYQLGTAYGVLQAVQNLGTALITMAAGTIVEEYDYYYLEVFFICWLVVAFLSSLFIWFADCANNGYINMSVGDRLKHDRERQAAEAFARRQRNSSYTLLRPRTTTAIRNRYLSKVGATLPSHLGHGTLVTRSYKD